MDPFEALGLPRDAPFPTIRSQYRQLLRRYHPNSRQGDDVSKNALVERLHAIQQAWTLLSQPDSRRRCLELLHLLDEQEKLLVGMAKLLEEAGQESHTNESASAHSDGNTSSDADEGELPHIGLHRRKTVVERLHEARDHHDMPEKVAHQSRLGGLVRRLKDHESALHLAALSSHNLPAKKEDDYFTKRRKKLAKLWRRENEAFGRYRIAMIHKFEAELEVEQNRDAYEAAKWSREYFERAPRETSERLRSFQHFMGAVRAFAPRHDVSRSRSNTRLASQILSTEGVDMTESTSHLTVDNHSSIWRPSHQRGWSSDVSGDQSSSEDDSSDGRGRAPLTSSIWRPRARRFLPIGSNLREKFQTVSDPDREGEALRGSFKPHGSQHPFKMIVKRPTNFDETSDAPDSSAESAGTSWPPSPCSSPSLHKFTMTQPTLLAEFLGTAESAKGPSASISHNLGDDGGRRAGPIRLDSPEGLVLSIKHVKDTIGSYIPTSTVYTLTMAEKTMALDIPRDPDAPPIVLMKRLSLLDSNIARKFIVKPDIKEEFNFRLIYTKPQQFRPSRRSFIALSYRRRLLVNRHVDSYTLPLEPELFQAVLEERTSNDEGVWVDQICIDQDSELERTISMSAMDMVYRSARLAVVVLDDLEFNASEVEVLRQHMDEYGRMTHVGPGKRFRRKQPAYLTTHEELCNIVQKLLRSSWFRRAWCRHEMRLAQEHVFLLPYTGGQYDVQKNIVRFTGSCLAHLLALATEVPLDPAVELVKPALHAFFRDRYGHQERGSARVHHGNFTTVIAEVFAMEAGGDPRISIIQREADALKDKTSIVLNTMECGLALSREIRSTNVSISKSECQYMLLTLALAARDPASLCSVGPPMQFVTPDALSPTASSTWLFEPTNVDSGLNNYRSLDRMSPTIEVTTNVAFGEHYVVLDLQMLRAEKRYCASDENGLLSLAQRIVGECMARPKCGRHRARYLLDDRFANQHFGPMRDVYVETLACVLACGADWMDQVCHRYGVSRLKQDLDGACALLIALKNTLGRWPEHAWSSVALGFIMDFVNFIIIRALPQRQIIQFEPWRPIWAMTENGGKVLTFVAPGPTRTAVPVALLDPDYIHLARLWVMTPRGPLGDHAGEDINSCGWTLLGKSVLFTDDLATDHLHSSAGILAHRQKVFGREDPQLQRLLRERTIPLL